MFFQPGIEDRGKKFSATNAYSPVVGRVVFISRFINWCNNSFAPSAREKKPLLRIRLNNLQRAVYKILLFSF